MWSAALVYFGSRSDDSTGLAINRRHMGRRFDGANLEADGVAGEGLTHRFDALERFVVQRRWRRVMEADGRAGQDAAERRAGGYVCVRSEGRSNDVDRRDVRLRRMED